jgi:DNA primase
MTMAHHHRHASNRMADDDFRRLIEHAKACKNLSDIIGRHTQLKKRAPSELKGLCPFHDERSPSFEVNDAKGLFFCHGCRASGDHFKALMMLDGMTFREAYEALTNDTFPSVSADDRARQREEDAATRAQAVADARWIWSEGVSIDGTPGEVYLREVRGITAPLPDTLRFGMVPSRRDDLGNWMRPYPAVLCACTDGLGNIVGVQRIFIRDDGLGKRWGKRSKLSIGRPKGSAFKLGPAQSRIIVCEGPEDGLSLMQALPDASVWVALGTAMMVDIDYPLEVETVVLAGDNDPAGRAAVAKAAAGLALRGLATKTMFPSPGYADWNDELRGIVTSSDREEGLHASEALIAEARA